MYRYAPFPATIGDAALAGAGRGAAPTGAFPVLALASAWRTFVRRLRATLLLRTGNR
jgi:hypothetical protein